MDSPAFVQTLANQLRSQLQENGLLADLRVEQVTGTKMFRFYVVSDGFADMIHSERQSLVWRIVDQVLEPSEAIKISMIMTLTKEEFGDCEPVVKAG
jgi:acid stress-induced BolA-like protein IbaG/YrbA